MSSPKNLDEVCRLERLAFRGWPALESQDVQGWHLRFSGGYTKRSNSINALGPQASTDIEIVEAPFRERGSVPVWRLTPLAPIGMADLLKARGYTPIERSLLQRCPLHDGFRRARETLSCRDTQCVHPLPPRVHEEGFHKTSLRADVGVDRQHPLRAMTMLETDL